MVEVFRGGRDGSRGGVIAASRSRNRDMAGTQGGAKW